MSTLELLVMQEYMIVYFHSATSSRRKLPGIRWFKRCYDMIDRRSVYWCIRCMYFLHCGHMPESAFLLIAFELNQNVQSAHFFVIYPFLLCTV